MEILMVGMTQVVFGMLSLKLIITMVTLSGIPETRELL